MNQKLHGLGVRRAEVVAIVAVVASLLAFTGVRAVAGGGLIPQDSTQANKRCWPASGCGDDGADCLFREILDDCHRCTGGGDPSAVCVYDPGFTCEGFSFVDCGPAFKGFCDNEHMCSGHVRDGECNLLQCPLP